MKKLAIVFVFGFIIGCGGGGGGSGSSSSTPSQEAKQEKDEDYLMALSTYVDLPSCVYEIEGRMVYIKDEATFYSCNSSKWESLDLQGKDGADGTSCEIEETENGAEIKCGEKKVEISNGSSCSVSNLEEGTQIYCPDDQSTALISKGLEVTSNKLLSAHPEDLCDLYNEFSFCYFKGGQIVKYSDGSVQILGSFEFAYIGEDSLGDEWMDTDNHSVTFIVPPEADYSWAYLNSLATAVNEPANLFLVYERAYDRVGLYSDTDENYEFDPTRDRFVGKIEVTNWE